VPPPRYVSVDFRLCKPHSCFGAAACEVCASESFVGSEQDQAPSAADASDNQVKSMSWCFSVVCVCVFVYVCVCVFAGLACGMCVLEGFASFGWTQELSDADGTNRDF
jgi:hypothetical protein